MRVRKAKPEEAQALVDLHARTVREVNARDYAPPEIEEWLAKQSAERVRERIKRGEVYVCEGEGGELLGFGGRQGAVIAALYVAPEHIRKGVGSRLLEQLERDAIAEGVEEISSHSTVTAAGFYGKRGYVVGERVDCPVTRSMPLAAYEVRKRLS